MTAKFPVKSKGIKPRHSQDPTAILTPRQGTCNTFQKFASPLNLLIWQAICKSAKGSRVFGIVHYVRTPAPSINMWMKMVCSRDTFWVFAKVKLWITINGLFWLFRESLMSTPNVSSNCLPNECTNGVILWGNIEL